MHLRSTFIIYC